MIAQDDQNAPEAWRDDDVVGVAEIARRLQLKKSTVDGYRHRPTKTNPFPKPDGRHDKRTPWWWWKTICQWQAGRGGLGWRAGQSNTETGK